MRSPILGLWLSPAPKYWNLLRWVDFAFLHFHANCSIVFSNKVITHFSQLTPFSQFPARSHILCWAMMCPFDSMERKSDARQDRFSAFKDYLAISVELFVQGAITLVTPNITSVIPNWTFNKLIQILATENCFFLLSGRATGLRAVYYWCLKTRYLLLQKFIVFRNSGLWEEHCLGPVTHVVNGHLGNFCSFQQF